MQDYKSLRVAVMIYATAVNRQTDRQLLTGYTISSASSAKSPSQSWVDTGKSSC